MSLLVWLPLNGNIKNQGLLGNVLFVNGTPASIVSNDNGKIGKCYTFSGTHKGIDRVGNTGIRFTDYLMDKDPNTGDLTTAKSVSLSAWVKVTSELTTYPLIYIGYVTSLEFGTTCKFRIAGGSTRVVTYSLSNYTNKWYHIAGVYNKSTQELKLYLNGECVSTKSGISNFAFNSTDTYATRSVTLGQNHNSQSSTDSTYYLQGSLNDVRIYDHALSPLEVKELAKGLVCHYTLNDNCLRENLGENLATTGFSSWGDSNSTSIPNSQSPNGDTSYTNVPGGGKVYSQIKNSGTGSCGIYIGANTSLTAGKLYLCSCWIHINQVDNYKIFYLRSKATGGVLLKLLNYCGIEDMSKWPINLWIYISCLYTADADYPEARLCTYTYTNGTKRGYTNWQIREVIAGGEVSDCSGYLNNGTITGLLSISEDTSRYNNCCKFDGNSRIVCDSPTSEAKTLSLWAYVPNPITAGVAFADYKSELAFGFTSTGIMIICCRNSRKYAPALTTNLLGKWHHFCIIKDGTLSGVNDLYIDGNKITLSSSASNFTHDKISTTRETLMIGGRSSGSNNYTEKISDVRLYSTALSQQDVTDLYNMGCLVSL